MKYTYVYKTSDGVRHEGRITAENRAAAFTALREQGIRAIKVIAADGSKENGEVVGFRPRTVLLLLSLEAIVIGTLAFLAGTRFAR